jgi:hypothetical protein
MQNEEIEIKIRRKLFKYYTMMQTQSTCTAELIMIRIYF